MRAAEAVSMIREGLGQILNDVPQAMTYEVVADFSLPKRAAVTTQELTGARVPRRLTHQVRVATAIAQTVMMALMMGGVSRGGGDDLRR